MAKKRKTVNVNDPIPAGRELPQPVGDGPEFGTPPVKSDVQVDNGTPNESTSSKIKGEDPFEKEIYLAVITASVQSIHKSHNICNIDKLPALFKATASSANLLAEMYIQAYREKRT